MTQRRDESPIELKVHSNFEVKMSQLTEIPEELHVKLASKAFEKAKMMQKQIEERQLFPSEGKEVPRVVLCKARGFLKVLTLSLRDVPL